MLHYTSYSYYYYTILHSTLSIAIPAPINNNYPLITLTKVSLGSATKPKRCQDKAACQSQLKSFQGSRNASCRWRDDLGECRVNRSHLTIVHRYQESLEMSLL